MEKKLCYFSYSTATLLPHAFLSSIVDDTYLLKLGYSVKPSNAPFNETIASSTAANKSVSGSFPTS